MVTVPKDAALLQTHEDNKCNSTSLKLKNESIPTDNVTNQDACCRGVQGSMRDALTGKGPKGFSGVTT